MKIARPNKKYPGILLVISGFIAIVVIAIMSYVFIFRGNFFGWTIQKNQDNSSNQPFNNQPATDEQIQSGINTKAKTNDQTNNTSPQSSLAVTISAVNQTDTLLQIRAITNTISDTGECTLTLTKGSFTITKISGLQALPSTSTCKGGFDVAKSELTKGEWQISINITVGTLSGTAKKSVEIK
jgi:preprotein translocase subunit SecF